MVNKILPLLSCNQIANRVWSGLVASLSTVNNRRWHFKLTFNFSEPACYSDLVVWRKCKMKAVLIIFTLCCAVLCLSHVRLFAAPWTVACQAPLSMGFSRQDYWSGLPCPPPGDLPDPGFTPASLMSPALAGSFFTTNTTWEVSVKY